MVQLNFKPLAQARVDLHKPKMLILQFHTPKMLIIQSGADLGFS